MFLKLIQIKKKQAAYEKYELNFATATIKILTEAYICETMCNSISVTWKMLLNLHIKTLILKLENCKINGNDGSLDRRKRQKI